MGFRDQARILKPAETRPEEISAENTAPALVRQPFARVPTHAVGVAAERRTVARAYLRLPLRLVGVDGKREPYGITLLTQNISASGIYFLAPRPLAPGVRIELEVGLVHRPFGRGSVRMTTAASVVRQEGCSTPGWHGIAARFDDFHFSRDESLPPRFGQP